MDRLAPRLEALGIRRGGALIVHSAFSGLARAGWSAEDFQAQLADYMSPGTLLMPTFSWRAVNPENPFFSERETPSITGYLTEHFRTTLATHRSLHPTHATAAWGPDAAALTDGHALDDTPCSANSPFGRLTQSDGQILLVGVGFERCTNIHCGEEAIAPDLYLRPDAEGYQCEDRQGRRHSVRTRRHLKLDRDFEQFRARLRARDQIIERDSFGLTWSLCDAKALETCVSEALRAQPDIILAKSPPAR